MGNASGISTSIQGTLEQEVYTEYIKDSPGAGCHVVLVPEIQFQNIGMRSTCGIILFTFEP